MFVACAAYCYPCLMGCDPYDKKDVIKVDIPRPPGHLDAEFKMRALGVVPTVTFPGGNIAPTGHSEMTKNDEGAGAQAVADGGADVLKADFLSSEAEFFVSALSAGPVADSELDETRAFQPLSFPRITPRIQSSRHRISLLLLPWIWPGFF